MNQLFPELSFDTITEDILITIKVPVSRKKSTKEWKELWFELQKRPFFKRFPNKKFPTNRLMYQLYQEDIDQVWPSSAKNCKKNHFVGQIDKKKEKSGQKNVGRKKRQFLENSRKQESA